MDFPDQSFRDRSAALQVFGDARRLYPSRIDGLRKLVDGLSMD
ncbi:MAG: hypothetical protein ACE144_02395 [Thermodesulfobacteriota bacterium]